MDSNILTVVCLSFAFLVNFYVFFCNLKEMNLLVKQRNELLELCIDLMEKLNKSNSNEKQNQTQKT